MEWEQERGANYRAELPGDRPFIPVAPACANSSFASERDRLLAIADVAIENANLFASCWPRASLPRAARLSPGVGDAGITSLVRGGH